MRFFNICPAGIESGGPELAHQMCHRLLELGEDAKMFYIKSNTKEPQDVGASAKYIKYGTSHTTTLAEVEREDSVVVFNEGATGLIPFLNNCKKVLWWMSVDNYLINTDGRDLDVIRNQVVLHLVQSKYAYEYVKNVVGARKENIMYVSDYIGDLYMTDIPEIPRQNIALYNPKKGLDKIKPLIEKTTWLKWVPLINLSEQDMVAYMHIAKVYVDFGNHPGKDRIPREAAICGCAVLTNKKGSAAYQEDVPIPDEYKFEDENQLELIDTTLKSICDDFEAKRSDFNAYRDMIVNEKSKFSEDVRKFSQFFKIGG